MRTPQSWPHTYLINDGVTTQSLDVSFGIILRRLVVHGQIGMEERLKVKGRFTGVVNQQVAGQFRTGNADFISQRALCAILFGLLDAPTVIITHAVRHMRPVQNVLGAGGFGVVIGGFQFPFVETRKALRMVKVQRMKERNRQSERENG